MEMVASVKLRGARSRMLNARPYDDTLQRIATHLRKNVNPSESVFLAPREVKSISLIVVGSDKGLCGAFNSNICRAAMEFIKEHNAAPVSVTVLGKKPAAFFKRRKVTIGDTYENIFFKPTYEDVLKIGENVLSEFRGGLIDEVWIAYNQFKGTGSHNLHIKKFLPVTGEEPVKTNLSEAEYVFEPAAQEILDGILARTFVFGLWRIVLESYASEQSARMITMNGASKNANELIGKLTLIYDKARQSAITKELLEVVAGAESMK
jgi:F-type H+-transporting ATPase subunit gamma